jgi:hypothetical protein
MHAVTRGESLLGVRVGIEGSGLNESSQVMAPMIIVTDSLMSSPTRLLGSHLS